MTWRFVEQARTIRCPGAMAILALWLAACSTDGNGKDGGEGTSAGDDSGSSSTDDGSSPGDSGGSGGTAETGDGGGSGTTDGTGDSGGSGTTGATSSDATEGTGTASDTTTTGAYTCPPNPAFNCSEPMPCDQPGDMCGDVDSPFDEHGCLRPTCTTDEDCEGTDLCYRPMDFGGCASSGLFCEDDPEYGCVCGGTPDCSGAYCVPEEIYPG